MGSEGTIEVRGHDDLRAAFNVAVALAVGLIGAFVAPPVARLPVVLATAVVVVLLGGARFRLRVGPGGLELVETVAFALPVRRRRFGLDADLVLRTRNDADRPEGLAIVPTRGRLSGERETTSFGPSFRAARLRALHATLREALAAARDAAPPAPTALRNALLTPQVERLDLTGAERDPRGRLRAVRSTGPVRIGGVLVPAGSTFELNGEAFLAPERDDLLRAVVLGGATTLPSGLAVVAGTHLGFTPTGSLQSARGKHGQSLVLDGYPLDGSETLLWDPEGRLVGFTLVRPWRIGGHEVPARSRFSEDAPTDGEPRRWTCVLGGPLALPELRLEAGDTVFFQQDARRLVAVAPGHDLRLDDALVRRDGGPIPVTPEGRVDRAACARRGLLERRVDGPASPA